MNLFEFLQIAPRRSSLLNGLVSAWNWGEASSTTRRDWRGTNPLTSHGTTTAGNSVIGGCITTDGSAGNYASRNSAIITNGPLTFACWSNPAALADAQSFFSQGSGSTEHQFFGIKTPGGRSGRRYTISISGGYDLYADTTAVLTGVWTHTVFTSDGAGNLAIWVNGTQTNTASGKSWTAGATASAFCSTPDGTASNFNGSIGPAALWNRVLTAAEIAAHYNGGRGILPAF